MGEELVEKIAMTILVNIEPHTKWDELDIYERDIYKLAARETLAFLKYSGFIK